MISQAVSCSSNFGSAVLLFTSDNYDAPSFCVSASVCTFAAIRDWRLGKVYPFLSTQVHREDVV